MTRFDCERIKLKRCRRRHGHHDYILESETRRLVVHGIGERVRAVVGFLGAICKIAEEGRFGIEEVRSVLAAGQAYPTVVRFHRDGIDQDIFRFLAEDFWGDREVSMCTRAIGIYLHRRGGYNHILARRGGGKGVGGESGYQCQHDHRPAEAQPVADGRFELHWNGSYTHLVALATIRFRENSPDESDPPWMRTGVIGSVRSASEWRIDLVDDPEAVPSRDSNTVKRVGLAKL